MFKIIEIISTILGNLLYFTLPGRRKVAYYNLNIIFPEMRNLEKKKLLKIAL